MNQLLGSFGMPRVQGARPVTGTQQRGPSPQLLAAMQANAQANPIQTQGRAPWDNPQAQQQAQQRNQALVDSPDFQQASRDQNAQANQRQQDDLLRRMGHTREGVNRWGDQRAQGIASSILDYYQPGHPQYEAEIQRMQGIQGGWNPYTGQQGQALPTPLGNQLLSRLMG